MVHPTPTVSPHPNQVNGKSNHQAKSTLMDQPSHANMGNAAPGPTKPSSIANGPVRSNKKQQKQLTPEEIQSLLQSKIGQLNAEQHLEQEEDKEMGMLPEVNMDCYSIRRML